MDQSLQISTPSEHPCYAGHFPGYPVVPGVLLLELVAEAVGAGPPRQLGPVKFHRALSPGESFTLHYTRNGPRLSFRCERDGLLLAEGNLTVGNDP